MTLDEIYKDLVREKEKRTAETHKLEVQVNEKTLALFQELNTFGLSHRQPEITRPSGNTIRVKLGPQQSLHITVQGPDKFEVDSISEGSVTVSPVRGKDLSERDMKKLVVGWFCPEVRA